ncbi:hypothetical protein HDF19_08420 [Mucilaginibacter sp. E4BP6]|uniref:hypothetical protein n=1 Tax=Mucilaginibacter sp. E4BP6 TaxID=2723089 RepID=UPI0015C76AB2|nr:hypothetical protein [Mucilaginibacter sp. E4BP6]NYE68609.1 hypothetical protein [Mucilaginibacter sp. E4BP6]
MTTETYKLSKDQFLEYLEPFKSRGLPTDSIIHKMVTGCGATTLELKFPRNSIIIEPNLPVIKGKCDKLNKKLRKNKVVQGVYEGIDVEQIKQYLKNRKGYKKILTTPEGFEKVAEAIGESMYKDYFLLFDECEKAIQDVEFRSDIINPIDAFFEFDNKAFVSATPLIPSDPRFNKFTQVVIEPNYVFAEPISIYTTNNIVYQLKLILDHYAASKEDAERKIFMFFKSTKRIRNIIKGLRLKDYAVYCSEKSVKELRVADVEHAYDGINDKFAKYNFLTSRFYSAVDIDYDQYKCDPIIIMISDVIAVEHSVIDPKTESIQICGRFRKPEKIEGEPEIIVQKDIYHISNYSSKLTNFSEAEITSILEDKGKLHHFISTYKPKSDVEYINKFIDEILELNGFGYFLREKDGALNHFMVDNFINTERVKGYYKSARSLKEEYANAKHFLVDAGSNYVNYCLDDEQLSQIKDSTTSITLNDFVSSWVKDIMENTADPLWQEVNINMIKYSYPEQINILQAYGMKNAAEFDYSINTILKQLADSKGLKRMLPILKFIQRTFKIGNKYSSAEIEAGLIKGIAETGLNDLKPGLRLLREGAMLSERKTIRKDEQGKSVKGHEVLGYVQSF